ncbi:MAG TPA: TOMM precursor leader peptide-binding protein [Candidatus Brocadiaceae bacterium]
MEFSRLLRNDAKISWAKGVSLFRSHDDSLFLKQNNQLFRISSGSKLAPQSRIFQILRRPRKLEEILNIMSEFKRGDIIDVLHTLYDRNFITIRKGMNKKISNRNDLDLSYFLREPIGETKSPLSFSQIILIGNGLLADRLSMTLKKLNLKIVQIESFAEVFRQTIKTRSEITGTKKGISNITSSSLSSSFTSSLNKSDLIIVAEDYQDIALFELINKICFKKKKAWIRMSFDDNIGYLGPLVIPGRTACFNCCELRLVTNSPNYEYELWKNNYHIPKTRLQVAEIFADFLSVICAKEALSYLTHVEQPETVDNLILFDTRRLNFTKHKVFRHPNCIYCNSYGLARKLHSKSLHASFHTTRKIIESKSNIEGSIPISESELLERLRKLIDLRTGIILETKKYGVENRLGINSHYFFYARCHKPLRIGSKGELTKLVELGNSLIYPSPSGSGLSPNEAEIHTLMEVVERYSNMVVDESRFIWSTYRDIEKIAINPLDLGLHLDENYIQGKRISKYSVDSEIPWIQGHDVYSGKPVFVASDFVHYPSIRENPIVYETSNGSSAHTDIVQAVLNGLYEAIERDSFLTMWLNRIPMPMLDIKTIPHEFNESIKLISGHGMNVKLVDLTNDSHVPTVMAVCSNNNPDKYPALEVGTATHIEPKKAIQKALLEMETGIIHNLEDVPEKEILDPDQITSIHENAKYYRNPKMREYWEFMISSKQTSKLSRYAGRAFRDHNVLLMQIVKQLHTSGHRVVYVDITPSDIRNLGLRAVKVFVTGFQPMYVGNKLRLNLDRLHESAEYVRKNIGIKVVGTELNSAPHPLA